MKAAMYEYPEQNHFNSSYVFYHILSCLGKQKKNLRWHQIGQFDEVLTFEFLSFSLLQHNWTSYISGSWIFIEWMYKLKKKKAKFGCLEFEMMFGYRPIQNILKNIGGSPKSNGHIL